MSSRNTAYNAVMEAVNTLSRVQTHAAAELQPLTLTDAENDQLRKALLWLGHFAPTAGHPAPGHFGTFCASK
jgi:hypothetical protein